MVFVQIPIHQKKQHSEYKSCTPSVLRGGSQGSNYALHHALLWAVNYILLAIMHAYKCS